MKTFWPDQIILELTTKCNLRCVMCAINYDVRLQKGGSRYGDLDFKAFENLKSVLPKIKRIDLNGHGESLVNPHFLEIFEEMKKTVPEIGFTTNALLINDNVAYSLVENRMNEIIVSIHAADGVLYKDISKNGKLETVISNLKNINHYKEIYQTSFPAIKIQFVGMKRNIHQIEAMVNLAHKLKATDLSVLPLVEYASVQGESLSKHPDLIKKYLPPAIKLSRENGVALHFPPEYLNNRTFLSKLVKTLKNKIKPRQTQQTKEAIRDCIDPWSLSFISNNGDVKPCCMIDRSMGNLVNESFESIWFGEKYSKLRDGIISKNPPPECLTCVNRPMTTYSNFKLRLSDRL